MSDDRLPQLPSEVEGMLEIERRSGLAPEGMRAQVLARIAAARVAPVGEAGHRRHLWPVSVMRRAASAAVFLLISVGVGIGATRLWRETHRPTPVLPPTQPAPAAASPPTAAPRPIVEPLPAPPSPTAIRSHSIAPPRRSAGTRQDRDPALARERVLLDRARAALAARDGKAALGALRVHLGEFPAGRLAEERESMWISALLMTGAHADATRAAVRFRRRFPGSVFQTPIDDALRTIEAGK